MRCSQCGASIPDDARWCGQCYTPVEAQPEPAALEEVAPVETGEPRTFAHPDSTRPAMNLEYSRWKKSSTTFGPFGRVVASLLLLIPLYFFFFAGVIGFVGLVMWVGVVMPMALRSIWARGRVIRDNGDG